MDSAAQAYLIYFGEDWELLRRMVEPDLVDIRLVEVFSTGVALSIRLLIRFSILRSRVLA